MVAVSEVLAAELGEAGNVGISILLPGLVRTDVNAASVNRPGFREDGPRTEDFLPPMTSAGAQGRRCDGAGRHPDRAPLRVHPSGDPGSGHRSCRRDHRGLADPVGVPQSRPRSIHAERHHTVPAESRARSWSVTGAARGREPPRRARWPPEGAIVVATDVVETGRRSTAGRARRVRRLDRLPAARRGPTRPDGPGLAADLKAGAQATCTDWSTTPASPTWRP